MSRFCCILKAEGEPAEQAELLSMMGEDSSPESPSDFYLDGPLGIAGRPLSIAGQVRLAADLRLDGRDELRRELPDSEGLSSAPDLLLRAYLCWGQDAFSRLLGDNSCVLWDGERRTLFAYRSLFGIKPLFYARVGGHLYLASEMRQLLRLSGVPTRLDEVALADYLMDDSRDEHRTFFADIHRLPPGHLLMSRRDGNERNSIEIRSLWRPDLIPRINYTRSEDYGSAFRELFHQAVKDRLRDPALGGSAPSNPAPSSPAPSVGLLMSGGLDSCSVAVMANKLLQQQGRKLTAFTYTFPTLPSCDEGEYVQALAREIGLDLRPINAEASWLFEDEALFKPVLENPFQGWEGTDQRAFRHLQDEGAKVLLTGHGGDNIVQGTIRVFLSLLLRGQWKAGLGGLRRQAEDRGVPLPQAIYRYLFGPLLPRGLNSRLRALMGREVDYQIPGWIQPSFVRRTGLKGRLFRQAVPKRFRDPARQTVFEHLASLDSVGRACDWHTRTGARFGIEVRHPFLDQRLADFVLAVPPQVLFRGGERKILLREALAGMLPELVRQRQGKTSFAAYIDRSLGHHARKRISLLLKDPILAQIGVVDGAQLRRSYQRYCQGENPGLRSHLWYLITAETWLRSWDSGSWGSGSDASRLQMPR